jgi:Cation transport protein
MSGAFSVLSKLVVIAVMIRGRHRGLPVAIDRAIVLPQEFNEKGGEFGPDHPPPDDPERGLNTVEEQRQKQHENSCSHAIESTPQVREKFQRPTST